MPYNNFILFWKQVPFIRMLIPFALGIWLQWNFHFTKESILLFLLIICVGVFCYIFLSLKLLYKFRLWAGVIYTGFMVTMGLWLTYQNDIRNASNWYGHNCKTGDMLILCIAEPLIEKNKSFKSDALVEGMIRDGTYYNATGKLLLYFPKDSLSKSLDYGDKILVRKDLQPIKNSGNPGAFDYSGYAAFHQQFHTLYLTKGDWVKLPNKKVNAFRQFIFNTREKIIQLLRKSIQNSKDELGIAEALLIGYTNDLDKDLVQAYSNTGVIHIIAISGMHLGLIYILLVWVLGKIPVIRNSKFVSVSLILGCLWVFSLLTGASASVLRSAVMFSCITIGKNYFNQSSVFNTLASSAFLLLCYNPNYLWDVGFQLSYLAIIGIVVFQQPIYNCMYFKNIYAARLWKLMSISLSAQLLTFPICIYYFHQFPNLFLISNIIAVPLSSLILYLEIAVIVFCWVPFLHNWLSKFTQWLIWLMNKIILYINDFPFAVWDRIPANSFSTVVLYMLLLGLSFWLLHKKKRLLILSMFCCVLFAGIHCSFSWQTKNQQKLIVYNVPKYRAIDFISGSAYFFVGDSLLQSNNSLQNFYLNPSRVNLQLNPESNALSHLFKNNSFYQFGGKKIILLDKAVNYIAPDSAINVDIIVVSKNPNLHITQLAKVFHCKKYVFDASNRLWKIAQWKQECKELNLPYYSVPDSGAFVLDL